MKLFFILTAIICVMSSCKDDSFLKNESKSEDLPSNSVAEPSVETLHTIQTDKQIMLYSMIRYNSENKKYELDLSFHDAKSLGISKEAYDEAIILVTKMNESKFPNIN